MILVSPRFDNLRECDAFRGSIELDRYSRKMPRHDSSNAAGAFWGREGVPRTGDDERRILRAAGAPDASISNRGRRSLSRGRLKIRPLSGRFGASTRAKVVFCLGADQSEAAMIRKVSNVEIVVPTVRHRCRLLG